VGGAIGQNSHPELTLPETGTYQVQIFASNGTATGPYSVAVEGASPATSDAVAMVLNEVVQGEVAVPAGLDEYTFSGTAGDIVTVTLVATGGAWGGTAFYTLVNPSGSVLASNFAGKVQITLAESGTHVFQVHSSNALQTGTYALGLEGVSPVPPGAVAITRPDTLLAINLGSEASVDVYTFTGTASENVTIGLISAGLTTGQVNAQVFRPSGTQVNPTIGQNGEATIVLPESGTYVIHVYASNLLGIGIYAIYVQ
jgi:hypothetical protein